MPCYVYAIPSDSRINRFYGSFADYREAEIRERDTRIPKVMGYLRGWGKWGAPRCLRACSAD
jgi:hypothetical protein